MKLSDSQFGSYADRLRTDGGFSVNPMTGHEPTTGAMVARPGHEMTMPADKVTGDTLKQYAGRVSDKSSYMGGWVSEGTAYLDVSQNITPNAKVAAEYGESVARADMNTSVQDLLEGRGEKAAYDLDTGQDIPNRNYRGR